METGIKLLLMFSGIWLLFPAYWHIADGYTQGWVPTLSILGIIWGIVLTINYIKKKKQ